VADLGNHATPPDEPIVCSARGCRAAPSWVLEWNNPRIHTPQRRKTWLACEAHKDFLADFLGRRGFLRDTHPFTSSCEAP